MRGLLALLALTTLHAAEYHAPAGDRAAVPRPGAESILPGGRLLQPMGRQYATGPHPFGIAVSPNGQVFATADGGAEEFSITVLRRDDQGRYRVDHILAPAEGTDEARVNPWRGVSMGIAFAGDDEVFVSEGESGRVRRLKLHGHERGETFDLNTAGARDSFSGDLAYDPARHLLYVLDQANFRLAIFQTETRNMLASLAVGRLPFAIGLSPDGKRAYVTNVGMFEYSRIGDVVVNQPRDTGLKFPAFGFPSTEAVEGVRRDTQRGEASVSGLGDPNAPQSNSLCVVNVEDPANPKVVAFLPTGTPVGAEVFGGSSPSDVLATADRVYVANAHDDSITVFDAASLERIRDIPIRVPGLESIRGVMPIGLAYHAASHWLLVAEAGLNAVGVIDTEKLDVAGHIPAGWYPSRILVHEDNVYVVNTKGHGTGPNANRMIEVRGEPFHRGVVNIFPIPAARDLTKLTRQVLRMDGLEPQPGGPSSYPAELRYVVLIVKHGRSFDELLGDVDQASNGPVNGAPMLARFGRYGTVADAGGGFQRRFSLRGVNVTPNHHAMALRWAFSDNFYVDSETGYGGHHWLAGAPPNAWALTSMMAAAGGQKHHRMFTPAPGRLEFPEGALSVLPEEIPERGTLWRHLERHGISFRNFGLGLDLAGVYRSEGLAPIGARFLTNIPMPEPLYRNTSRDYPTFNTTIPDQYRATQFINEIEELYRKPGLELPRFLSVFLPNDAMALARPGEGYPFTASYVADNDYAMGRIVQYLSGTPWWRNMAVFVVEDGSQDGVDHIDSHRSLMLAIGPYARKNYVSRRNVSYPGLLKTIFGILGAPPLNLSDAAATDLSDCFTTDPDFAPYEVQPIQEDLFVPDRVRPR